MRVRILNFTLSFSLVLLSLTSSFAHAARCFDIYALISAKQRIAYPQITLGNAAETFGSVVSADELFSAKMNIEKQVTAAIEQTDQTTGIPEAARNSLVVEIDTLRTKFAAQGKLLTALRDALEGIDFELVERQWERDSVFKVTLTIDGEKILVSIPPPKNAADRSTQKIVGSIDAMTRFERNVEGFLRLQAAMVRRYSHVPQIRQAIENVDREHLLGLLKTAKDRDPNLRTLDTVQLDPLEIFTRILESPDMILRLNQPETGSVEAIDPVLGLGVELDSSGKAVRMFTIAPEETRALPRTSYSGTGGELERAGTLFGKERRVVLAVNDKGFRSLQEQTLVDGKWIAGENFPEGAHVYLLTTTGDLISSPRIPNRFANPRGNVIATHRALLAELQAANPNVEIAAAGEFHVLNGAVSDINNRAGSFHGGPLQLVRAENALRERGFPVEAHTRRTDFFSSARSSDPHEDVKQAAKTSHEVATNPAKRQERETLRKIYARLAEFLPSSDHPGHPVEFGRIAIPADLPRELTVQFIQALEEQIPNFYKTQAELAGMVTYIETDGFDYVVTKFNDPAFLKKRHYDNKILRNLITDLEAFLRGVEAARAAMGLEPQLTEAELGKIFPHSHN